MKFYIVKTIATVQGDPGPSKLYFAGETKTTRLSTRHSFSNSQKHAVRFPSRKQAESQVKAIGHGWVVRLRPRR